MAVSIAFRSAVPRFIGKAGFLRALQAFRCRREPESGRRQGGFLRAARRGFGRTSRARSRMAARNLLLAARNLLLEGGLWSSRWAGSEGGEKGGGGPLADHGGVGEAVRRIHRNDGDVLLRDSDVGTAQNAESEGGKQAGGSDFHDCFKEVALGVGSLRSPLTGSERGLLPPWRDSPAQEG